MYGDEVRIKQILVNLLNNAVKYTPEGSVTLSIQLQKKEGDDVRIAYSVADTGIGIKKESIPYLFSAFKRVDEEKNRYIEGSGLGLSIVKQLVTLMGGDIEVNSVYTKGSTFVVMLPQKARNRSGSWIWRRAIPCGSGSITDPCSRRPRRASWSWTTTTPT